MIGLSSPRFLVAFSRGSTSVTELVSCKGMTHPRPEVESGLALRAKRIANIVNALWLFRYGQVALIILLRVDLIDIRDHRTSRM